MQISVLLITIRSRKYFDRQGGTEEGKYEYKDIQPFHDGRLLNTGGTR